MLDFTNDARAAPKRRVFFRAPRGSPTRASPVRAIGTAAFSIAIIGWTAPSLAIVSSNTGLDPPFSGTVINYHVGAGTFYDLGFFGSRARVANVEAGAIWNGHESLAGRVSQFIADPTIVATGTTQLGQYDWHATMVGQTIGGAGSFYLHQAGIAPTAELWSGSIATAWIPDGDAEFVGGFDITDESFFYPYVTAMRTGIISGSTTMRAHIVNSSWGYPDSAGQSAGTIALDALAIENNVVNVVAAGNSGPSANTVGGPASGYNTIAVAALTGDMTSPVYSQAASFSSRGPGDFYNPATDTTVPNARATVDIAAPGDNLTLAFYGGLTGGHVSGTAISGTAFYIPNEDGTSFAAPIVAGGAGLMVDAAELFVSSGVSAEMLDARVIKAAMLASAKAPAGWNNGQATLGSMIETTQALDHATGAGMLDLDAAYRLYVGDPSAITIGNVTYVFPGINTTLGVAGTGGGDGLALRGWDLGTVLNGGSTGLNGGSSAMNTYTLGSPLAAGDTLTAALTWFADRTVGSTLASATDVALGNLSLQVWRTDGVGSQSLVAQSIAPYGTTEFLRFTAPQSGTYSLRILGLEPVYDLGPTPIETTSYGLAWQTVVVPEPSTVLVTGIALAVTAWSRSRSRPQGGRPRTARHGPQRPAGGGTSLPVWAAWLVTAWAWLAAGTSVAVGTPVAGLTAGAAQSLAVAVPIFGIDDLAARYDVEPSASDAPTGLATTSVGGGTFDVNAFLGAGRYYGHTTPITGQNTITTNLEAGHVWNGHESLTHVTSFTQSSGAWGGGSVSPLYDRHATWAGLFIGGRQSVVNPSIRQQGIAYGTDLRSAAIATNWSGSAYALSFDISGNTLLTAYNASFGTADVINSSFGGGDPSGTGSLAWIADAYSFGDSKTTYVVSSGNSGPSANTVGSPGSAYNTITVGALGGANAFNSVASFSSRGPQDFGYFTSGTYVTVAGVRAAVDISAPGESLTSAFYGGQNGGNNTSLAGSVNSGTSPTAYSANIAGTSFAAPIVAGGAALVASAAKTLSPLASNADASQSMVVKSLLLTGADKTSGWSNGQQNVTVGGTTFLQTTQSLDWAAGAGRMNLDKTFDIQLNGQTDVSGTTGLLGSVARRGWDYGSAVLGTSNDYIIDTELFGSSTFTATLSWMRARDFDGQYLYENAQANLGLSVWSLDTSNNFTTLVARSASQYNTVEHLSFTLPAWGRYGLRVEYASNTFDNTGGQWGTASFPQAYGLAWTAVPEPATVILAGIAAALTTWSRARHRFRR